MCICVCVLVYTNIVYTIYLCIHNTIHLMWHYDNTLWVHNTLVHMCAVYKATRFSRKVLTCLKLCTSKSLYGFFFIRYFIIIILIIIIYAILYVFQCSGGIYTTFVKGIRFQHFQPNRVNVVFLSINFVLKSYNCFLNF